MGVVDIKLANFLPSLAEVPTKELEALKERARVAFSADTGTSLV